MSAIRRAYGIDQSDYDDMLKAQGGRCAICGKPPRTRRLAVDHDHTTGYVRGLLCSSCNRAIAVFRDNAEHIRLAAKYLESATLKFESLTPTEQDQWLLYRGRANGKGRRARVSKAGAPRCVL